MINGHEINGAEINGSGSITVTLSVDGVLPALTGEAYLYESDPNGVRNGVLPALTGIAYGGANIRGTLPALTGTATGTVETVLRATGILPGLTGEAALSAERYLFVDGMLPALDGAAFGGAFVVGTLPALQGSAILSSETLMAAIGALPKLSGIASLSSPTTLRAVGILPALQSHYGIAVGSLPAMTGYAELTAEQVRALIAYALNIASGAMTQYPGYPFQHIVRFKGKSYGFDATGGYLLEGADDNGEEIAASATLPDFDYGTDQTKNVPYVYVGTKCENIMVKAVVDESEIMTATEVAAPLGMGRNKRAKFGRGLTGVMWSHTLSNVNGGEMDIDSIVIHPDVKRRRM